MKTIFTLVLTILLGLSTNAQNSLLYDSKGKIKEETIYFYNCKGKLRKKIYLNNTSKNEPDAIYEGSSKIISKYTYENY